MSGFTRHDGAGRLAMADAQMSTVSAPWNGSLLTEQTIDQATEVSPHLQRLEAEAIFIIREVAACCERPVMLVSIGKDSSVMLHLARKAFYPSPVPFPLFAYRHHMEVSGHDPLSRRDRVQVWTAAQGLHESRRSCLWRQSIRPRLRTLYAGHEHRRAQAVAVTAGRHDAAFGGARRDEEKSRAKERIVSFRTAAHGWDPKNQRPELWSLYNTRVNPGESIRVFPLSNWTELDVWEYILAARVAVVPLYFAAPRPVVLRDGQWIMVDDARMRLAPDEVVQMRRVRFRTLGCYPLTAAIESSATDVGQIVAEIRAARTSERQGRLIDRDQAGAMEMKKRDGYSDVRRTSPAASLPPLVADARRGLLRFLTCGSVDDGKSTLIGRLLHDSHGVPEDELAAVEHDSRICGTTETNIDFALLVDGLVSEREQNITIDVAHRYFATTRRRFIVADAPGHEQYTRNMATAASNADVAVLLVDARHGLRSQTMRHAHIASLLRIRHVVLAVTKMDLVEFDSRRFADIERAFVQFSARLRFDTLAAIPVSGLCGDNVVVRSRRTQWYGGPSLLEHLEDVEVETAAADRPFRYPVQWVNRPDASFRGYAGTVASGTIHLGDPVVVPRTGQAATIDRIVTFDGDLSTASTGAAVTLVLNRDIDVSRGDILSSAAHPPDVCDQFAARVIWMSERELLPGRPYLLKLGTRTVGATITDLKHRVDIESLSELATTTLQLNDIGSCNLALAEPMPFDPYDQNQTTGAFILMDRFTNATVAAGMIQRALRRATNIQWQVTAVDKHARAQLKDQKPCILWFTGLSGAGKSTIANCVERKLLLMGRHTYLLDGDNVRHGLNRDLGFTDADRVENVRRVAEAAKFLVDAGLIVLVSLISPCRAERLLARELVGEGEFIEIFVDAPLELVEARDPKGLYRRARAGEIRHFTGIDSPYQPPLDPEIHLDTAHHEPAELADVVLEFLDKHVG